MNALWETLGNVLPRELVEARLQLHHAAQLVGAAGRSLAAAQPDDGHTSLEWWPQLLGLTGVELPGPRAWRVSLRLDEPSIGVLVGAEEVGRLSLAGCTQAEAFAWLVERARENGAAGERLSLDAPYTLPRHPLGAGARYAPPGDGSLVELTRWFSNAASLLRELAVGWAGAAPVRVWPHHFDIASVLPLAEGPGPDAPSIGIGLSPGDETIAEPYFYVTPWPRPAGELPELPAGGRWHRGEWTGAVLEGAELVAAGGGAAQAAAAGAFLRGTVEALGTGARRRLG